MASITVDPEKLTSAASAIETEAGEYKRLYEQLFTETANMRAAWDGADNEAFTNQIEGFRADFNAMYSLMSAYAEFLRQTANTYSNTQNEVISGAKRLAN